jgi:hypothetical protein
VHAKRLWKSLRRSKFYVELLDQWKKALNFQEN